MVNLWQQEQKQVHLSWSVHPSAPMKMSGNNQKRNKTALHDESKQQKISAWANIQ
jgi:hypothetical protein